MHRIVLLCLGLSVPLAPLQAATAGDSLAGPAEAAWQRALQKLESTGRREIAAADRRVASAWWADTPTLELSHRTGDWGNTPGERESEISLAWPTWLPGERSGHREAAARESELAAVAEQEARLRLAGDVRELAWRIAGLQGEVSGATARAQNLRALAEDAERRLAARELSRADALAARAEWLDAESAALDAHRGLEATRAQWDLMTGSPILRDPDEAVPSPDAEPTLDDHPAVRLASAAAAQARAQSRAARIARIDRPELRVLYREEVVMEGLPVDRSMGLGVRIPLGSARKATRNAVAQSAAEVAEAAALRERDARSSALALAREGLAAAGHRLDAAELRATLLRERLELLDRSYQARETSLLDILRERRVQADGETALARARAAFGLAKARLLQSLGMLP